MKLTEEQEKFIAENFNEIQDLNILTQKAFEDESLDGRSKQGRAVRKFMIDKGLDYKTKIGRASCRERV